jgi:hypothetical protein
VNRLAYQTCGLLCTTPTNIEKDGDMSDHTKKSEANAPFAKAQQASDAKRAMSAYESEAVALRAKTERLKALRLARDAANPQPVAAAKSPAKRKGGKNAKSTSLSSFLDGQAKEGRNG